MVNFPEDLLNFYYDSIKRPSKTKLRSLAGSSEIVLYVLVGHTTTGDDPKVGESR